MRQLFIIHSNNWFTFNFIQHTHTHKQTQVQTDRRNRSEKIDWFIDATVNTHTHTNIQQSGGWWLSSSMIMMMTMIMIRWGTKISNYRAKRMIVNVRERNGNPQDARLGKKRKKEDIMRSKKRQKKDK